MTNAYEKRTVCFFKQNAYAYNINYIVFIEIDNLDSITPYACDSPLKYLVSHFKTLKFVSLCKAL